MLKYSFNVAWSEADGEYVATSAEFPGLSGMGPSAEAAVHELDLAMEAAVEALIEDEETIPEPVFVQEYSGQFRLRLPKSTHAALAQRAELEGVSLNSLAQSYIEAGLSADGVAGQVGRRLEVVVSLIESAAGHMREQVNTDSRTTYDLRSEQVEAGIFADSWGVATTPACDN